MCRGAWALLALAAAASCGEIKGFTDDYALLWGSGLGYRRDTYFDRGDRWLHHSQGGKEAEPTGERFGIRQLLVGSEGDVIVGITATGRVVYWVQEWVARRCPDCLDPTPVRSHYAYIEPSVTDATAIAVSKGGGVFAVGTLDGVVRFFKCHPGSKPVLTHVHSVPTTNTTRMSWSGLVQSMGAIRSISISGRGDVIAVAYDWYVTMYTLVRSQWKTRTTSFLDTHDTAGGIPAFVDAIHIDGAVRSMVVLLNDGTTRRVKLRIAGSLQRSGATCDPALYTEGVDYTIRRLRDFVQCKVKCMYDHQCTGFQTHQEWPGSSKCVRWLNGNCHKPEVRGYGMAVFRVYESVSFRNSPGTTLERPCAKSNVDGVQSHCTDGKLFQLPLSQRPEVAFLHLPGSPEGVITAVRSPTPASEVFAYHMCEDGQCDRRITAGVPGLRATSDGRTLVVVHQIKEEPAPDDPQYAVVVVTLQFYTPAMQSKFARDTSQVRFEDALVSRGSVNPQEVFTDEDEALQPLLDMVATVQPFLAGEREDLLCRQLECSHKSCDAPIKSGSWLELAASNSLCPAGPTVLATRSGGSYADQYHERMEEDVLVSNSTSTSWCVAPPILQMQDRVAMPTRLFCMPPLAPLPAGAVCIDYTQQLDASLFCDKGTSCVVEGTRAKGHCRKKSLSRVEVNVAASLHARTVAVSLTVDGETSHIKVFARLPWQGPVPTIQPERSLKECAGTNSRVAYNHMCHDGTYCKGEHCCRHHGGILRCPPTQPDLCSSFTCSDDCGRELLGKRPCFHLDNSTGSGINVIAYHTSLESYTYGDTAGRPCPIGYGPIMNLADCQRVAQMIFTTRLNPRIDTVHLAGMPRCYVDESKTGGVVLKYNKQGLETSRIATPQRGLVRTLCRAAQYVVLGNRETCWSAGVQERGLHYISRKSSCQEAVLSLNLHSTMEWSGPPATPDVYSWGGVVNSDDLPGQCFATGRVLRFNYHRGRGNGYSERAVCSITETSSEIPPPAVFVSHDTEPPAFMLYPVLFILLALLFWWCRVRGQQQGPTEDDPLLELREEDYIDLLQTLVVPLDTDNDEAQGQCTVCLDDLLNAECVQLPACGHFLHHECLRDYVVHLIQERRRAPQCPNCRSCILLNGGDATDGNDADSASGQNDDETSPDTQQDPRTDDLESRAAAVTLLVTPTPAAAHQAEDEGEAVEMADVAHSLAGVEVPDSAPLLA